MWRRRTSCEGIAGSKLLTELADLTSRIATEIPRITNADATKGKRGSIAVSAIEIATKRCDRCGHEKGDRCRRGTAAKVFRDFLIGNSLVEQGEL
jgi:hypothetical protein